VISPSNEFAAVRLGNVNNSSLCIYDGVFDSTGSGIIRLLSNGSLYIGAGGYATRIFIDSTGEVGIGTTSPEYTLDVVNTSSAYAPAAIFKSNNDALNWARVDIANTNVSAGATGLILLQDQSGGAEIRNISNAEIRLSTNDTERMRIDANGNVGIGTPITSGGKVRVDGLSGTGVPSTSTRAEMFLVGGSTGAGEGGELRFGAFDNPHGFASIKGFISDAASNSAGHLDFYTRPLAADTSMTLRMRVASDGAVTIGGAVSVGSLTETSSLRYKENVKPLPLNDVINSLNPVVYDRKDGSSKNEVGFIAEDVATICEELVAFDSEGRPDSVNYTRIIPFLVAKIQELEKKLNDGGS
jgi:hypothetical protein